MKRKTVALYDPYLDTLGGGEEHILSFFLILDELGYEITIYWDTDLHDAIRERFHLLFKNKIHFKKNIFRKSTVIQKLQELHQYDIFVYVTDGSYFFSSAKQNYIFSMYPDHNLYKMNILNKLKTINYSFICNSNFTKHHLTKWGINAEVLYPLISDQYLHNTTIKKEKIILSVGRFFEHLHSKRQDISISYFKELLKSNIEFCDYTLILAGGLKEEDEMYYKKLQTLAEGNTNITFRPNISYEELLELYKKSEFYWHFAGYDINDEQYPERVEHLGITPIEAMANGCITCCYATGGPKEIITHEKTGFLFKTFDELQSFMLKIQNDTALQHQIRSLANKYVKETFSYSPFKQTVLNIIKYHL
ncbi:MAG: glycosyltransferase family 4 protein [Candidatus Roizmanbacteria bacterium]